MESSSLSSLFSWLTEHKTSALEWQGKQILRYQESDYCSDDFRYRIVFAPEVEQVRILKWLDALSVDFKLAQLIRANHLTGLELSLVQEIDSDVLGQFALIKHADIYPVSAKMPLLNKPGLLVMDMDSTAIEIECIDELAAMAGVGKAVAEVTELAMQGELDFEQSLRQRVAKLTDADAGIIQKLCGELPLAVGLKESVAVLQDNHWRLVVASGGFTPFVNHLKGLLSLDAAYANELVIAEGKLSGQVTGTVVDAQYKADVVNRCAEQWQIELGQRVAIGDGANDIPMIETADYGIAYHAKPKLEAAADVGIRQLDLNVLPFLLLQS